MPSFTQSLGELSPTLHGVVISSSLLTGATTALMGGILADRYGRPRLIATGAVACGLGMAIECAAPHLAVFLAGRLLKGAGDGLFLSTVYVQVSEMSPSRYRGVLTSFPQFMIVVGVVTGFFVCYGTALLPATSASWRLPLGLGAVLALVFAALLRVVPPSPRWLLARGRPADARAVADRLGLGAEERDELLARHGADAALAGHQTLARDLAQMLGEFATALSAPYRARTLFGCFLMAFQQFSGIDGVLYYAPLLFRQAGLASTQAAFLASGVSSLVILAVTVPATLLADRWGRRTSALVGGTSITVLMLLMGTLYAADGVHADSGAGRWVVIVSIYVFAMVFNGTWAIGFRAFLVESLPRKTRSSASSLAQSSNWVCPRKWPVVRSKCVCSEADEGGHSLRISWWP